MKKPSWGYFLWNIIQLEDENDAFGRHYSIIETHYLSNKVAWLKIAEGIITLLISVFYYPDGLVLKRYSDITRREKIDIFLTL